MRTISDYIDQARQKFRFPSDRQLSLFLGVAGPTVTHWRGGRQMPADGHMVALAKLAGIDPMEALAELGVWRTQKGDPAALPYYREMLAKFTRAAILVYAVGLSFLYSFSPADAAERTSKSASPIAIYYVKWRRRIIRLFQGPAALA